MSPSRVAPSGCNGGGPMTLQKTAFQWPHEAANRHSPGLLVVRGDPSCFVSARAGAVREPLAAVQVGVLAGPRGWPTITRAGGKRKAPKLTEPTHRHFVLV